MRAATCALLLACAAATTTLAGGCASGNAGRDDDDADASVTPDPEVDAGTDPEPEPSRDSVPVGAVSWFHRAACPTGWRNFDAALGRTLMASPDGTDRGTASEGTPLRPREQRGHEHTITGMLTTTATSFVGVAGSGNGNLAGAGSQALDASGNLVDNGLPYAQLLACEKTAAPSTQQLPRGTLLFFPDDCPSGWSRAPDTRGRFLVGLPNGGAPGTFGGRSLGPGERRLHGHDLVGTVITQSYGIALASGCCGVGYASAGTYSYAGATAPAAAGLPYLQLPQCRKD